MAYDHMMVFCTVLLAGSILFLTAAFAGVPVWTLGAAALALSLGHVLCVCRPPGPPAAGACRGATGVVWTYAAILALLFLSAAPLPLRLTAFTGAERFRQNTRVAEATTEAARLKLADRFPEGFALTRNRAGTLRAALLTVAVFSAAALAGALTLPGKRAFLRFLTLLGAGVAVAGYIGQWRIPQGDTLWWLFPVAHSLPGPVACFVNHNHFAGFVAMLAPIPMAFLLDDLRRRRWLWAALSLAAFTAMTATVVFSLSRGAVIAMAGGLLFVALLSCLRVRPILGLPLLLLAAALAAGALALTGPTPVRERLQTLKHPFQTASFEERLDAWRGAVAVWRTYPIGGAGVNAFRMVYPQHRTTSRRAVRVNAENEYVQLPAETGLVGVALAAILCAGLARHVRGVVKGGRVDTATALSAAGAAAVAAIHAGGEFALRIPLYALTLAAIVGLLTDLVPRRRGAETPSGAAWPRRLALPVLSLLTAAALGAGGSRLQRYDSTPYTSIADMETLTRALTWAPTYGHVWTCLGRRACEAGTPEACRFGERCLTQAADYDPNSYPAWLELGKLRLSLKDHRGAREAFARVRELRSWVPLPDVPED